MPVQDESKEYKAVLEIVNLTNDFYAGREAVKKGGEKYLPKPSGQSDNQYNNYKARAGFLPVVKPTLSAMVGSILRKEPVTNIKSETLIKDIQKFAKGIMISGRHGVLVEFNESPVLLHYDHKSIINWSKDYIVLSQKYITQDEKDKFKQEERLEYLELTFDADGFYIQNVWRQGQNKQYEIAATYEPLVRGQRMDFIPFVSANEKGVSLDVSNPVLSGIANLNLDHYQLGADLRHGLHWTALPTLFLFGDLKDEDGLNPEIRLGAGAANSIPDTDARAELLEYTGAGLKSVSDEMQKAVESMAALGSRLLQGKKAGVESAETARINASSTSHMLNDIVVSIEDALKLAYSYYNLFLGITEVVEIEINRDFIDASISPQDVKVLLESYISGAISLDTFLYNMEKGERLQHSAQEEKALIIDGESGIA